MIITFIIASAALIQVSQAQSAGASANLNMNLTLQANGQPANNAQPVFAPFDLIRISTNITGVNAPMFLFHSILKDPQSPLTPQKS